MWQTKFIIESPREAVYEMPVMLEPTCTYRLHGVTYYRINSVDVSKAKFVAHRNKSNLNNQLRKGKFK